MLDIHCHILPGVDDGAAFLEESLEMARQAAESGVRGIVATPHGNIRGVHENYWSRAMLRRLRELRDAIAQENIPLSVYAGMEVYATPEAPQLILDRKLITINDSRYLLVEFDFASPWESVRRLLTDIQETGVVPLVAHPERYDFLQAERGLAHEIRAMGCLLQLNKGSALGNFGSQAKAVSRWMLKNRLADVMASDAHSPYQRTPQMLDAEEFVCSEYSEAYANLLLRENPRRIVQNAVTLDAREELAK